MSNTKRPLRTTLTDLEHAVMNAVWQRGEATAAEVREGLKPRYVFQESTVRTLLTRLEKKGCLKHRVEGRTYVYAGADEPRGFAVRAVRQIIDRFCAGSAETLLAGMVEDEVVGPAQLRRLADEIEARRKKR